MACVHEGGYDPCIRYRSGSCKIQRKAESLAAYYANRERRLRQMRAYDANPKNKAKRKKAQLERYGIGRPYWKGTPCDKGQASEYFVAADLLARGLDVTKPLNINGKHDLHAWCAGRWHNIQVKSGRHNAKTGRLVRSGSGESIVSDILAIADVPARKVSYIPITLKKLPKELTDAA